MAAQGPRQLVSWKEVAEHLGRDVRTVVRWEKDKGLPVHRVPGGKRQSVYAYTDELDSWLRGEAHRHDAVPEEESGTIPFTVLVPSAAAPQRRVRRAEWALLIAIALICFSLLGFLFRPQPLSQDPLRLTRVSTEAGIVSTAALSPDGRQVAYSFRRRDETLWHVYLQLIGAGDPVRLTHGEESEGFPAWSPDGRFLAFTVSAPGRQSIAVVPALGGTPRLVTAIHDRHALTYVNWTPDGKGLVYPDRDSENEPVSTWIFHMDTGQRTRFFSAPDLLHRDYAGAFSPDGKAFAFVRATDVYGGELLVMPAAGGEPRKLTDEVGSALAWTADSQQLVFQRLISNSANLWRIAVSGGQPRPVTTSVFILAGPSIARTANGMSFVEHQNDANIWRLDLAGSNTTRKIIADSLERDVDPACSVDGKRLAFLSYRNGADLWIADAQGAGARRLTYLAGTNSKNSGTPDWSPDQRSIAFSVYRDGQTDIAAVEVASGDVHQVTSHPANDGFPRWSRDSRWIYFTSDRSGRFEMWRMAADGSSPVQVTHHGGYVGQESPDGKYLYFGKYDADGLWRMPAAGGDEELVIPTLRRRYAWTMSDTGIFFINGDTYPGMAVHFYSFANRQTAEVFEPAELLQFGPAKMSACRDGKTLFISESDVVRSELIWAENFK